MLWVQDKGYGQPLVLLHPVGTSGRIWWQHIDRLAQRFRVLAVDLPGHGRSPRPEEPLTLEGMSHALYQTLRGLKLPSVHLVGLSLGGMVAQILAVEQPAFVASLTLCDTICEIGPQQIEALNERAEAVERGGMQNTVKPTLERWFAPGFASRHLDVVSVVEKILSEADPVVNADTWRAITKFNVAPRLVNLCHVPTLVINGALDQSIPPNAGKRLAGLLAARRVELPGCAHMAPIEAPEEFMDLLEPFLLDIESNRKGSQ